MQQSMEINLVGALLSEDTYSGVGGGLSSDMFTDEIGSIVSVLIEAHEKHEGDISVDELEALHQNSKILSEAQKGALSIIYDKLRGVDSVNKDVASTLLKTLYKKSIRYRALDALAQCIEANAEDHSHVITLLDDDNATPDDIYESVSSDSDAEEAFFDPSNVFPFNLQCLAASIPGGGRGNMMIIYARSNIGKSSFVASCVAGYLNDGYSVLYFANEEPGAKIMRNIKRAVLGLTDKVLNEDMHKVYTAWDDARKNLSVKKVDETSIEGVISYAGASRPDIIVLDQMDKFSTAEKFSASHERLKALYTKGRLLAQRRDCFVIAVTQASADAEPGVQMKMSMMEGSKVGKSSEADIVIGIGQPFTESSVESPEDGVYERYLYINKNKINGVMHTVPVSFNSWTNQWGGRK